VACTLHCREDKRGVGAAISLQIKQQIFIAGVAPPSTRGDSFGSFSEGCESYEDSILPQQTSSLFLRGIVLQIDNNKLSHCYFIKSVCVWLFWLHLNVNVCFIILWVLLKIKIRHCALHWGGIRVRKKSHQQTKQRDSLLSIQFSPTTINTESCKVFDESPTPKLEGFPQLLQLRIFQWYQSMILASCGQH
jgi:hypothetical protein